MVHIPLFSRPLSLPLAIIPERAHGTAIVTVLNRVFAGARLIYERTFS